VAARKTLQDLGAGGTGAAGRRNGRGKNLRADLVECQRPTGSLPERGGVCSVAGGHGFVDADPHPRRHELPHERDGHRRLADVGIGANDEHSVTHRSELVCRWDRQVLHFRVR
jgi:hypothetical protein